MVQQFGHAGCDQSIQATAILLVEKKHFSKTQIELWKTQLRYVHSAVPKRHGSTACHPDSPQKCHVLGEKGNILHVDVDPWEEELNTPPSAEEEWLWVQISVSNDDTQQTLPLVMQEGQIPEYQVGPEVVGDESEGTETEDDEQDGDEEQETQLGEGIKTKKCKVPLVGFDDHYLAVFMYSHLLPETSPLAGCHRKVLNKLYENNQVGV